MTTGCLLATLVKESQLARAPMGAMVVNTVFVFFGFSMHWTQQVQCGDMFGQVTLLGFWYAGVLCTLSYVMA